MFGSHGHGGFAKNTSGGIFGSISRLFILFIPKLPPPPPLIEPKHISYGTLRKNLAPAGGNQCRQ